MLMGTDGSSPQAWGTHSQYEVKDMRKRFIPTGVGNTQLCNSLMPLFTVHPHRRGEHGGAGRSPYEPSGSSPQAWGTHQAAALGAQNGRFIPTGVGNT